MISYTTKYGQAILNDSLNQLEHLEDNSINLVMTSPPFALLRKKEYGNKDQHEYIEWLSEFAALVHKKLKDDGSFVLDLGGAYQQGLPVRSLYNFRIPIHFCDNLGFHLAEDFYWYNPSKLPSPIEWVNRRKIRAKDSVNNVWWFSKKPFPKSNISNVLVPYSESMKRLLKDPDSHYKPKLRPSGHDISKSFSSNNGGAIPSNLLQIANAESNSPYLNFCKKLNVKSHPARFPLQLPEFFVKMLTDEGDLVVDIFSGSNTTGQVCERLKRNWISIDNDINYMAASIFRFIEKGTDLKHVLRIYHAILNKECVDIGEALQYNIVFSEIVIQEARRSLQYLQDKTHNIEL
ncbi:site-specific DNA-methyltransferase [Mucilaginibacter sp. UR6-1]|uniref:DNA-methyltransferase n=1 Tax=Mucilaginibacter sp. UR6-1 TaxID=1435643 RepID=UPI001E4CA95E|nr:site-specific DNA-methyltransferase [Mucilaginibacter sp. UR6-1]MCC8410500.1 site-specific DNA-methyltransferase [Mucilaginibacter sp. UR6-1]